MKIHDYSIKLAQDLYKGGWDLNDIWILGQNLQANACDKFWIKIIEKKEVSIKDIES